MTVMDARPMTDPGMFANVVMLFTTAFAAIDAVPKVETRDWTSIFPDMEGAVLDTGWKSYPQNLFHHRTVPLKFEQPVYMDLKSCIAYDDEHYRGTGDTGGEGCDSSPCCAEPDTVYEDRVASDIDYVHDKAHRHRYLAFTHAAAQCVAAVAECEEGIAQYYEDEIVLGSSHHISFN